MKLAVQRALLALGLAATLLAAYFAPEPGGDDDGGVVLTERSATAVPAASPVPAAAAGGTKASKDAGRVALLPLMPRMSPGGQDDGLFGPDEPGAQPGALPPAPAPVSAPAAASAPPVGPTLPLKMIGRYEEDGRIAAFVQLNEQNLVLRQGDLVAEHYRVERIDEHSLTVRHVPLDQTQTVTLSPGQ